MTQSKKVLMAESYGGWYAYWSDVDPDAECIVYGHVSRRSCYHAVRAKLGADVEITNA